MAYSVAGINYVTSPSGLLVPEVTDNPGLGNGVADVSFDIVPSTANGWVLTTEGGEVVWAPPSGEGGAGVDSIEAESEGALTGDVTLSEGSNITLTTAGNNIEIAASGGGITELSYVEFTSNVTISSTTSAGANTAVTSDSVSLDGSTRICIEFYSPYIENGSSATLLVNAWEDSTDLGQIGYALGSGTVRPMLARLFRTPSNGSHTYSVRGWRVTANGIIGAGNASSGSARVAGYIRITSGG